MAKKTEEIIFIWDAEGSKDASWKRSETCSLKDFRSSLGVKRRGRDSWNLVPNKKELIKEVIS